jgi:DNA-binding CsgD family transcriptional regulator/tetratricopeptide (TPR) repeat protein
LWATAEILGGVAARISSSELVGRTAELASLTAALAQARRETAQIVLVGGEAGVGKSRIVAEFVDALPPDVRVLTGYCLELRQAVLAFAPLVGMLRQLSEQLGPERTQQLYGRELRRFLPEHSATAERAAHPTGELFGALYGLLANLDDDGALILVVEDLQWADRSTLDLLSYLARELEDTRVLLIGTYRTDEMRRSHPLRPVLAELNRLPNVSRLDVKPLSEREVAQLLSAISGGDVPDRLGAEIADRAEGNPFFAEELLAAVGDRGVPSALRDILTTRLEALPDQAQEVLRIAAAAGRRVDHRLLSAVAPLSPDELDQGLRDAVEHGVLVPDGFGYRFRHALLQEAAHDQLLPGERTRLHAAFADVLSREPQLAAAGTDSVDAELAYHALQAMDVDRAYPATVAAGYRARDLFAYPEAFQHFERALDLLPRVSPGVPTDPEWRLLSLASECADEPDTMIKYARRAIALLDPERDAEALGEQLSELSWKYWIAGSLDRALETSAEALELLPPEPTPVRAAALSHRSRFLMFAARYEEAAVIGTQAVAVARAAAADRQLSLALNSLGCSLANLGQEDGLALLRESIEVGIRGAPTEAIRGYNNLGSVLTSPFDRVAEAERVQHEGIRFAEEHRAFPGATSFLRLEHANALIRLGRWDEADDDLLDLRLVGGVLEQYYGITRTLLLGLRGRYREAAEVARKLGGGVDEARDAPQAAGPIIEALLRLQTAGHWPEPVPIPDMVRATTVNPDVFPAAAWRARAALARLNEDGPDATRHEVDVILDELRATRRTPRATEVVAAALDNWIAFVAAERSRIDAADPELWKAALSAMRRRVHAEYEMYAQFRLAEALAAHGDSERATAELGEAYERATRLGAEPLADDMRSLARRARLRLSGVAAPGANLLTAREAAVLGLVAEGLTNREIGKRLFISEKTASVHISNLMAKLGVTNRTQAVHVARERGIAV